MPSVFGENIKVSIFGQSHSEAIGVVVDGLPAGFEVDMDALNAFLARRAPGQGKFTTARKESDLPEFVSGIVDGVTCGAPLCALIRNKDTRSGDYADLRDHPRPSHADYPAYVKFGAAHDIRGGGHFSGRLTAPLCVAGGIALQMLAGRGVRVGAHLCSVGDVQDERFDPVSVGERDFERIAANGFPVLDEMAGARMFDAIERARMDADSIGGTIECAATGLPAGLGDALFGGLEGRLSQALFGIPAVKGVEFGSGFDGARMRGSENNDPFVMQEGSVRTLTNNAGGILGGIATGMPLIMRVAIKPTPSIGRAQRSVSLSEGKPYELTIRGRHDPCIAPRAVPVVEAAVALVLLDMMM
ncbi:MAG: chorismate synthase [Candidatus Fimadaptatus sp.]|jgi:chorismate synthase